MASLAQRSIGPAICGVALFTTIACLGGKPFERAKDSKKGDRASIDELVESDPDIRARDLFFGVGGAKNAPRADAEYRFLKRSDRGMSPNFNVEDSQGRKWDAKFGLEAKSEVAASRLLWAIGFRQPPVYYVAKWRITSGEETGEQSEARFRLERRGWKKAGTWAWRDNPFVGTRELGGLVVMMAMLNSWDLKTSNNMIYEIKGGGRPSRVYVVKDLGESLGRSVNIFLGSESKLSDFAKEGFIRGVKHDKVDLYYRAMLLNRSVDQDITVEDVLWTCRRLDQLSDRQWRDAFRAGGYSEAEVTAYVEHMKRKVRDGLALLAPSPS
jgi:hypothetical protein